ncbi:MAG: DUF1963 domain-containing protein [Phycisphaerales bacterium]|nr:DUF1963 domain-containing protein [Phycisphaerales bacterium]
MLKKRARQELIDAGLSRVADAILATARPAARILTRKAASESMMGRSRFGGVPDLPSGLEWPSKDGRPLDFLAQIALAEVAAHGAEASISSSGYLWFFYDNEASPWGFDPNDRGGWAVLHSDVTFSDLAIQRGADRGSATFDACSIEFSPSLTIPSSFSERGFPVEITESEEQQLDDLLKDGNTKSVLQRWGHHLLGWPHPVQNDSMELECAGASVGCNMGNPEGYEIAIERGLLDHAGDWKLLLQLDSDEQGPGWMWGDSGMLYFWIRSDQLEQQRFDKAWLVLQCY